MTEKLKATRLKCKCWANESSVSKKRRLGGELSSREVMEGRVTPPGEGGGV